jgi:CRISPR-associated protein Cmr2
MTEEFWKNKIRAFLHDPPDKVIRINDHVDRRMKLLGNLKYYADPAIPEDVSNVKKELKNRKYTEKQPLYKKYGDLPSIPNIHSSDVMASSLQRIDLEKSINNKNLSSQFYQIIRDPEKYLLIGEPVLRHPITGKKKAYQCISSILPQKDNLNDAEYDSAFESFLNEILGIEKEIFGVLANSENYKEAYFRLWRFYGELLKDKLKKEYLNSIRDEFINLPAYTISPDHTLFDHADATAAIFGAMTKEVPDSEPKKNPALLMFKISPVQSFIENARKEKDLWAGSHLLSLLTFQALNVIVDDYGPDAIIFPHLRGQPFFDKCYEKYFNDLSTIEELKEQLKIANIPNTFLAIVDYEPEHIESLKNSIINEIEELITKIFEYAWTNTLMGDVLEPTKGNIKDFEIYKNEISNYFNVTVEALPVPFSTNELGYNKSESYEKLKSFLKNLDLPEKVRTRYTAWIELLESVESSKLPANSFDLYALMFELLKEMVAMESRKFEKLEGDSAFKCSLCGELEAIGGKYYIDMKEFWAAISEKDPILIKKNEHLCPLCLLKRFYPKYIKKEKRWDIDTGFESVSEVALRKTISVRDKKTSFLAVIREVPAAKDLRLLNELDLFMAYINYRKNIDSLLVSVAKILFHGKSLLDNKELAYKENLASIAAFTKCMGIDEEKLKQKANEKELNFLQQYIEGARKAILELEDVLGEPEKHYAILMMDGDNMGKLLIGDDMEVAENYLHPHLLEHVNTDLKEKAKSTKRLLTPAAHASISRALMLFSVRRLPEIVNENNGILIYAGGDDVLALLPVDTALKCAYEIQNEFNKEWYGWDVMPGRTMSAGLFSVHYKHPLYDALDKARALEKTAKESGRDAIAMGYMKKSGSYHESIFAWSLLKEEAFIDLFFHFKNEEASKRLIFHLLDQIDSVPEPALEHYLTYVFEKHLKIINQEKNREIAKEVLKLPEKYLFCWNYVHGKDSERLRRFLVDDLGIDWANDAKSLIFDVGKTIRIFDDEYSVEIIIDAKNEKAILKNRDGRTRYLTVKKEHGKLNIYTEKIKLRKDIEQKTKMEKVKSLFLLFKILLDSDSDLEGLK